MKPVIIIIVMILMLPFLYGDVKPNSLFTDRMVLQRNQKVAVYGTAENQEKVTISFNGQKVTTEAKNKKWKVDLQPMKAGGPFEMVIAGKNRITLKDILIGDVWVLGGQSNMARDFRTYSWLMKELPDLEENKNIRWFKITQGTATDEPIKTVVIDPHFNNSWQRCSRKLLPVFSPAGYFFGIHRYKMNKVPLGLIYASRGATQVESWVPMRVLKGNPSYSRSLDRKNNNSYKPFKGKPNPKRPTALYNGTVSPLQPYTIKGVLWYQGESDSQYSKTYRSLFPDMIKAWRKDWGQGDFAFIFTLLSSHKDRSWSIIKEPAESSWAWQREAQACALKEPNTAMITAHDIGEWGDIHPQDKKTIGKRLALAAAKMEGEDAISMGPTYKSCKIDGNKVIISFDNIHGGLNTKTVKMNRKKGFAPGADPEAFVATANKLTGFTMCGKDRVFHYADAVIDGDEVIVTCDKIKQPQAVRYAWSTFTLANLYNKAELPAFPFRTDNYPLPEVTLKVRKSKEIDLFHDDVASLGIPMHVSLENKEESKVEQATVNGISAWKIEHRPEKPTFVYLKTDNPELSDNNTPHVKLNIVYLDKGNANVDVVYDSSDVSILHTKVPGAWKKAGSFEIEKTGKWKLLSLEIKDARFSKRCNNNDVRLNILGLSEDFVINGVYLEKKTPKSKRN